MKHYNNLVVVVSFLFCSGLAFAQSVELTTGEWIVSGVDVNGTVWDESVLVFTDQRPVGTTGEYEIEGFFDWVSNVGSSGRELFEGTLSADLSLSFEGVQLISPNGIVLAVYLATVTADGNNIVNGSWSNGIPSNDWSATRVVNPLCNGLMVDVFITCLLYTSPSPRDLSTSRMPSSA